MVHTISAMEKSPESETSANKKTRKAKTRKAKNLGLLAVETKTVHTEDEEKSLASRWLDGMQRAPEHIGHVLVSVTQPEAGSAKDNQKDGKRIDTLSRVELLNLSEKITIDGSSLRQIYETHLVGEKGLRRLIAEYLREGDLRKALRQEVMEREIDFERDPILRDTSPQFEADGLPSKKAMNDFLERAITSVNDSSEEAAFFKARATYEAEELQRHKKRRVVLDIALAVFIATLILLIIILYLSRR